MAVDLLVFGPHPDDLEIGAGGIVARHAALGFSVGLCDLTAGEMGSNGTVEERLKESEAACKVLGAAWRENLRWPDRRIGKDPGASGRGRPRSSAGIARAWSPPRTGPIGIPIMGPPATVLTEAVFNSGLRKYRRRRGAVEGRVDLLLLHQRQRPALVRRGRHRTTTTAEAPGARLPLQPVPWRDQTPSARVLIHPLFRQLVESRDAQFGAQAGVTWAEGIVVRDRWCGRRFSGKRK